MTLKQAAAIVIAGLLTTLPGIASAVTMIRFDNRVDDPAIDARIYGPDGVTPAEGAAYYVQLYTSPLLGVLAPIGVPINFGIGADAGYFDGGIVVSPDDLPLAAEVRAWDAAFGSTFEVAQAAGSPLGRSNVVVPVIASPADGIAYLVELEGFCIGCRPVEPVSEPGTLALLLLGATLVVVRRRPHAVRACGQ
jgi:hypothetical protein